MRIALGDLKLERLAGRYRIWVVPHLVIFIAAVGGLARGVDLFGSAYNSRHGRPLAAAHDSAYPPR